MTKPPHLSVVIPVYNEAEILQDSIEELHARLKELPWSFEIILAENGSSDRTVEIAQEAENQIAEVRFFSLGEPNYGKALKHGIIGSKGTFVVCDEIDLCDTDFYVRAMELLEPGNADMVVGSKVMKGASDDRPLFRHVATIVLNSMLRVSTGFRGTDTHGLKAFRRDVIINTVERCVVDKDLFASELVIRAGRDQHNVVEIPLNISEKRKPSVNLLRRVPNVLKNMVKLTYVIRFRG